MKLGERKEAERGGWGAGWCGHMQTCSLSAVAVLSFSQVNSWKWEAVINEKERKVNRTNFINSITVTILRQGIYSKYKMKLCLIYQDKKALGIHYLQQTCHPHILTIWHPFLLYLQLFFFVCFNAFYLIYKRGVSYLDLHKEEGFVSNVANPWTKLVTLWLYLHIKKTVTATSCNKLLNTGCILNPRFVSTGRHQMRKTLQNN